MLATRYGLTLFNLFEFEQNVRSTASRGIQNIQPGDKTKGDFHFFFINYKIYWYGENPQTGSRY